MTYAELVNTALFVEVMIGILLLGVVITIMDFIGLAYFANNLTILIGSLLMIVFAFFTLTSLGFI